MLPGKALCCWPQSMLVFYLTQEKSKQDTECQHKNVTFPLTAFTWTIQLKYNSFQKLAFFPDCIIRSGDLPYRDLPAPGREDRAEQPRAERQNPQRPGAGGQSRCRGADTLDAVRQSQSTEPRRQLPVVCGLGKLVWAFLQSQSLQDFVIPRLSKPLCQCPASTGPACDGSQPEGDVPAAPGFAPADRTSALARGAVGTDGSLLLLLPLNQSSAVPAAESPVASTFNP